MIKLYTVPNCENCKKVKSYLDERNIKYVIIDLAHKSNRAARKFYRSLNIETAPVITGHNNGEDWIITGYDIKTMDLLIGVNNDKKRKK